MAWVHWGKIHKKIKKFYAERIVTTVTKFSNSIENGSWTLLRLKETTHELKKHFDQDTIPLTLIYSYVAVGLYDTHNFEWSFFLKFLCTKIVKQFVFLVSSHCLSTYAFIFMKQKFLHSF